MEDWQVPLMRAMAAFVAESSGDVLEIGFGRGVAAELIQQHGVRSHTIVEPHPVSIERHFKPWQARHSGNAIRLIEGRWEDVTNCLGIYDAVLFHAYPLNEEDFIRHIVDSIVYAEHAMPEMASRLRPGGVFTYLSTEVDSLSRRHQRLLFRHFSSITTSILPLAVPPDTADTWWAPSMVTVKAVK
ncbi:MAG: class I SAM-dependent methyltransferase [Verrucomicrobiae bacterium]|nr:class I SAM-dependent methyltransferase [Verrucomicrobiae bacterium]